MENYILVPNTHATYDGSLKPRLDIGSILSSKLAFKLLKYPMYDSELDDYHFSNDRIIQDVDTNSIIYFQFPIYTTLHIELDLIDKAHQKGIRVVAIVHDINSLRGFKIGVDEEVALLNKFDLITLPSIAAENILRKQGLIVPTIIQQGPFDFLTQAPEVSSIFSSIVNFAGNISFSKAGFLRDINTPNILVFGSNLDFTLPNNVSYMGKFDNDDLIPKLNSGYGLLWDNDKNNDGKHFKSYEKYNWQYKLSLYLAAGIVPIADHASNVGKWLIDNKCGITIPNIERLDDAIQSISRQEYDELEIAVKSQQNKVRQGYYTQKLVKLINKKMFTYPI